MKPKLLSIPCESIRSHKEVSFVIDTLPRNS